MGNWATPQPVTVSAADDTDLTDDTATITHTTASDDANYNGLTVDRRNGDRHRRRQRGRKLCAVSVDDRRGCFGHLQSEAKFAADRGCHGNAYRCRIDDIDVALLTFTTSDWSMEQDVTVTAPEDKDLVRQRDRNNARVSFDRQQLRNRVRAAAWNGHGYRR